MSIKFVLVSSFTLALISGGEAFAAGSSADAIFNGQVADTCVLAAGTAGTLTSAADFKKLSSSNAGGASASVNAMATSSNYTIKTIAPTSFSVGDSSNVAFATQYNVNGATSAYQVPGATATKLNAGNSQIAVNLDAAKASGTFPAGTYTATVTVRCE
ncbi:hypothetical protein [Aestuariivirga litoralis]|uniref:hypothetical protein n=1 Tax=Aestuariivirga litoralis TaxID=2650924 RepID=UPI0018C730A4|nr:hypothetical protein [Aestuariivirga litoralis]MBG1232239.1 hypothetical protein [Aestuariivirga litoralis]